MRTFAAKARFFDAAKRGYFCGDDALIDADNTHFQLLRNTPNSCKVLAIKVSGQTKRCVDAWT